MTLAEARALCPDLAHAPHDPQEDQRALTRLARWLTRRFSPAVAPDPPDSILLDVTGSHRLFGSEQRLAQFVQAELARFGIAAHVAIAPTVGAAWAVACEDDGDGKIVQANEIVEAISSLPPRALRLDAATAAMLEGLGIETIGQLLALPRDALPARFGASLLLRIDQALGRVAEPLVPLPHRTPIHASIEFEDGVVIDSTETLAIVLNELLGRIIPLLSRCGCGARRIDVEFRRDRGRPPLTKTILLSRPSRQPGNLFNLLRCMLETVHDEEGFTAVTLAVPLFERLGDEQGALIEHEQQAAEEELDHLLERLRVRLGQEAVARARLVESYLPERTCAFDGGMSRRHVILSAAKDLRRRTQIPRCAQDDIEPHLVLTHHVSRFAHHPAGTIAPRPLHLFPLPQEVQVIAAPSYERDGAPLSFTRAGGRVHRLTRAGGRVHRLTRAAGPERIAGAWWEGHARTRDYFDAEDASGKRFWLFRVRESGRWFLHGEFA
jgi:protein ImuB